MKVWRMAMRAGSQGISMWPKCFELGVAAITYPHAGFDDIDLSKHPKHEPVKNWKKLAPAQHKSLSRVAYEMKKNDIIYVKEGAQIVCRGTVSGEYFYDKNKLIRDDENGNYWVHQIPVQWDKEFSPIDILLGSEQTAVLELSGPRLLKLKKKLNVKGFDGNSKRTSRTK